MSTLTYSVLDAEFNDGALAQGTEVRTRFTDISSFINGGNIDGTNLSLGATLAWTGLHSYSVTSAVSNNWSLVVNSVLNSSIYGARIYSNAAQVNSNLFYVEQDNASSTVAPVKIKNDGTGQGCDIEQNGFANGQRITVVGTTNTGHCYEAVEQGTGSPYAATLRTLTGLNSVLLSKVATSTVTIDNTATETAFTDLTVTLPANLLKVGTTIRGHVYGTMATPGAGPATARMLVRYGGVSGTILLDSGAITPTVSLVDSLIDFKFTLTCRTTGATGTIFSQGLISWNSNTSPVPRGLGTAGTGAGNSTTATIDTTSSNDLVVTFVWGSAVSGCTTNLQVGAIEILK